MAAAICLITLMTEALPMRCRATIESPRAHKPRSCSSRQAVSKAQNSAAPS